MNYFLQLIDFGHSIAVPLILILSVSQNCRSISVISSLSLAPFTKGGSPEIIKFEMVPFSSVDAFNGTR